jgi:hypothetical protein
MLAALNAFAEGLDSPGWCSRTTGELFVLGLDAAIASFAAARDPVAEEDVGCLDSFAGRPDRNAELAAELPDMSGGGFGDTCFSADSAARIAALAPALFGFGSHEGAIL